MVEAELKEKGKSLFVDWESKVGGTCQAETLDSHWYLDASKGKMEQGLKVSRPVPLCQEECQLPFFSIKTLRHSPPFLACWRTLFLQPIKPSF